MVQLNGARFQTTDFQTLDGAATMATAGVRSDSRSIRCSTQQLLNGMLHVCRRVNHLLTLIVNHEVRSYWIHVCLDLLFLFSCQDDVTQLMPQVEALH
jgi:hypothetical protein